MNTITEHKVNRVAFVSTRIAGTDGVSLEISKWAVADPFSPRHDKREYTAAQPRSLCP